MQCRQLMEKMAERVSLRFRPLAYPTVLVSTPFVALLKTGLSDRLRPYPTVGGP